MFTRSRVQSPRSLLRMKKTYRNAIEVRASWQFLLLSIIAMDKDNGYVSGGCNTFINAGKENGPRFTFHICFEIAIVTACMLVKDIFLLKFSSKVAKNYVFDKVEITDFCRMSSQ